MNSATKGEDKKQQDIPLMAKEIKDEIEKAIGPIGRMVFLFNDDIRPGAKFPEVSITVSGLIGYHVRFNIKILFDRYLDCLDAVVKLRDSNIISSCKITSEKLYHCISFYKDRT